MKNLNTLTFLYHTANTNLRNVDSKKTGTPSSLSGENLKSNATHLNCEGMSLPSFGQTAEKQMLVDKKKFKQYQKAQKYADKVSKGFVYFRLRDYDLDKLEGIQYGIKVFEGVNMKQIALLYDYLMVICASRGCSNGCVHCFVDAKPVHIDKKDDTTIKQMSWEEFCDLTEGFKELNNRLNTNTIRISSRNKDYLAPFWDADSMEIVLKDNNGKEHDMIDIAQKIYNDTGKKVLFDTAGWTKKDQKMQKRAEKYADFMNDSFAKNEDILYINISLNPFHKLNSKYVEYIKSDPKRAKKFRELYTDRMANVFYTFTPILDTIGVINRALDDKSKCDDNFKIDAQKQLIKEIRAKLNKKYKNDPSFSNDDIKAALKKFDEQTKYIEEEGIIATGRMKNLLDSDDPELIESGSVHTMDSLYPERIMKNAQRFSGLLMIDANGRVYASNQYDIAPTDIQLNFKNKNKKTPEFTNLINTVVSTDKLFEQLYRTY